MVGKVNNNIAAANFMFGYQSGIKFNQSGIKVKLLRGRWSGRMVGREKMVKKVRDEGLGVERLRSEGGGGDWGFNLGEWVQSSGLRGLEIKLGGGGGWGSW